ncbi:EpsD family peptidyl-prolyl cis-trans isomerase [Aquitalea pelogenes]|uniref:EpsD family peptidyl-prolyl cis-trans isomerase n=1 Tax=Aquitalea pelogenes TaxID=1293573 RepID=UPI0035B3749D
MLTSNVQNRALSSVPIRLAVSVMIACLTLTACNKDDKPAPSQVLAKVNDHEITVMQLNGMLRSVGNAAENATVKQSALDFLIDQEVLQQKAVDLKLDRDPDVMQAIEQAKRQILAAAALNKLQVKPLDPTDADVQKFYDGNPALFAQHASYEFSLFNLPVKDLPEALKTALNASHSVAETRQILEQAHQTFQEKHSLMAAEQVPVDLLSQLFKLKVGDILVRPEGNNLILVQLSRIDSQPLSLQESKERILSYLKQNALQDSSASKTAELRKAANVVYVKRFAEAAASAPTSSNLPAKTLNSGLKGF